MQALRTLVVRAVMLALLAGAPAAADVLHLNNGTRLEGDVKRGPDGYIVTSAAGKVTRVPFEQVLSIEAKGREPTADIALSRLHSLRRSLENISDLRQILERYRKFIEQNQEFPAIVTEAQADLQAWQQRQDQGMIRYGSQWILPEQKAQVQAKALVLAEQARGLIVQGRLRDADPILQQAMAEDPQSLPALYLRGVLLLRQDQLPAARKCFEALNSLQPNHGPTLNNLAVILWRQNQQPGAMAYYEQAMAALPGNRQILDNAQEAMQSLASEYRNHQVVQKTARRLNEQDTQLQATLSAQGLYRWGATWVNQVQMEQLRAAERRIQEQLEALSAEYDRLAAMLPAIDTEITHKERRARAIEIDSYVRDSNGNLVRRVPPAYYYDLLSDIDRLKAQRTQIRARLSQLKDQVGQVKQKLPVPKYSGLQQAFDIESAPGLALPPPPPPVSGTVPANPLSAPAISPQVGDDPPLLVPPVPASRPSAAPLPATRASER